MSDKIKAALIGGLIPAVALLIVAFVGNHKLDEIHVLVNSRMTDALAEIRSLKKQLVREQKSEDAP